MNKLSRAFDLMPSSKTSSKKLSQKIAYFFTLCLSATALPSFAVDNASSTATSVQTSSKISTAENMVLDDISMFHKAESYRYSSGQPTTEQLKGLKKAGIDVVINLRPKGEHDDSEEKAILESTDVAYHNIAIDGAKGLSMANVEALDKVLEDIPSDQNVLMHCASGNRVGAMMALRANWLHGASKEEALAIGEKYGMTSLKTTVSFKLKEPK